IPRFLLYLSPSAVRRIKKGTRRIYCHRSVESTLSAALAACAPVVVSASTGGSVVGDGTVSYCAAGPTSCGGTKEVTAVETVYVGVASETTVDVAIVADTGLAKEESKLSHVARLIAGIAYAVAHTRSLVDDACTPPSLSWSVAR